MIVKLVYRNGLDISVLLYSDKATAQPLLPGQSLEMMYTLEPDADGVSELLLICESATP